MGMTRCVVGAGAIVVAVALAGCGSSKPDTSGSSSPSPATSQSSDPATPSATTGAPRASPTPPRTSRTPTATPTPSASVKAPPRTVDAHLPRCAAAQLTLTALRGSGAQQRQYATVYVRNTGSPACWLVGYASVSLRMGGAPLGSPAVPAAAGRPVLELAPSASAQALVHGPSTCNAPVSDTVRVWAPGQTAFTDAAVPMRGCALTVDAFQPAAR